MDFNIIEKTDPEIAKALRGEEERQKYALEMIASENHASRAVLETMASVLNNKYSEGYPLKRYYGGNEFADAVETLAIQRAKQLFGSEHANVQPHAGSQANMAAYFALIGLGDKIMTLSLAQGGHLTHGSPVNFSGKWYKVVHYALNEEEVLDYDGIRKQALAEKPKLILSGYTAYPRAIDFKKFGEIAQEVGAFHVADISHIAGLVAGGAHLSPVPYADVVTTTTHKTLRGPRGALILCKTQHAQAVDKAVFPGLQGGPFEHCIAGKAVCFKEAMSLEFKKYAKKIIENAKALGEELQAGGLRLVSGGTDNHLLLVDLTPKKLTGKEAQEALEKAGIIVNKNMIPFDKEKPFVTSGIRVGTPALTTRGMGKEEMKIIGKMFVKVLENSKDENIIKKVREEVRELCKKFPIY